MNEFLIWFTGFFIGLSIGWELREVYQRQQKRKEPVEIKPTVPYTQQILTAKKKPVARSEKDEWEKEQKDQGNLF